jgi:hypothetical protein
MQILFIENLKNDFSGASTSGHRGWMCSSCTAWGGFGADPIRSAELDFG